MGTGAKTNSYFHLRFVSVVFSINQFVYKTPTVTKTIMSHMTERKTKKGWHHLMKMIKNRLQLAAVFDRNANKETPLRSTESELTNMCDDPTLSVSAAGRG